MKTVINTFFLSLDISIELMFVGEIGAFTFIDLNPSHNMGFNKLGTSRQRIEILLNAPTV